MCKFDVIKVLGYWGEFGDVQEMFVLEFFFGRDLVVNLSLVLLDDDGSDESSLLLVFFVEFELQCDFSFKGDVGENMVA